MNFDVITAKEQMLQLRPLSGIQSLKIHVSCVKF